MAARLMCNYPNIISCDQETFYNSRLSSRYFQILPDKVLKVSDDGRMRCTDTRRLNSQGNEQRGHHLALWRVPQSLARDGEEGAGRGSSELSDQRYSTRGLPVAWPTGGADDGRRTDHAAR